MKAASCLMMKLYDPLENELVALTRLRMPIPKRTKPLMIRNQSRW